MVQIVNQVLKKENQEKEENETRSSSASSLNLPEWVTNLLDLRLDSQMVSEEEKEKDHKMILNLTTLFSQLFPDQQTQTQPSTYSHSTLLSILLANQGMTLLEDGK